MNFKHDTTVSGEKLRVLTVIDVFTREALIVDVRKTYRCADVVNSLDRLGAAHGRPNVIQCDQSTEFTSMAMDPWAYWNQVKLNCSRRGRSGDNAVNEAFIGSVRQECLSQRYSLRLEDTRRILETWSDYNNHRPHSSLQ